MTKRTNQLLILWALALLLCLLGLVGCGSDDDQSNPPNVPRPDTTIADSEELPAILPGSCKVSCGSYRPGSCQCDPSCLEHRDCCKDYVNRCEPLPEPINWCFGRCGEVYKGAACQCDAACVAVGDCCPDLDQSCLIQSWPNPKCPEGTAASGEGDCAPAVCAAPLLQAGRLWRVTSMTILPKEDGCDLDDDGKPNNIFGKLLSFLKETGPDTTNYVQEKGLALVYRHCTGKPTEQSGSPGNCTSTLGWLPIPVSAATPLPITVHPGVWQGTEAGRACPARIQVSQDYYDLAPSAPLWLPLLPFGQIAALHIPIISATYRDASPLGVVLCGIVRKDQLESIVKTVPYDVELGSGTLLVNGVMAPDLDLDEDGKKESISIAVQIEWEPFDPKDAILLSTGLSTPVSQTEVP